MGIERKAARLRYLRNRWAKRLQQTGRFKIHTSLDPAQSCAIGTVQVLGVPTGKAVQQLWDKWRIIATPIVHAEYEGHPRDAERLHDARRDRYVRECDGEGGHGFLSPERPLETKGPDARCVRPFFAYWSGLISTAMMLYCAPAGAVVLIVTAPGAVVTALRICTQSVSSVVVSIWWTIDWPAPAVRFAAWL